MGSRNFSAILAIVGRKSLLPSLKVIPLPPMNAYGTTSHTSDQTCRHSPGDFLLTFFLTLREKLLNYTSVVFFDSFRRSKCDSSLFDRKLESREFFRPTKIRRTGRVSRDDFKVYLCLNLVFELRTLSLPWCCRLSIWCSLRRQI